MVDKIIDSIQGVTANKKISIGILGDWGAGKTTFLNQLMKTIESYNTSKKQKFLMVKFNASQHDDHRKIWYSLLNSIFLSFTGQSESNKKSLLKRIYLRAIKFLYFNLKIFSKKIVGIFFLIIFIVTLLFLYDYSLNLFRINSKTQDFLKTIAIILAGLISFKPINDFSKNIWSIFLPKNYNIDYEEKLGDREVVKRNLNLYTKMFRKMSITKVIICIDELDRCEEKTIVQFFKALEAFHETENFFFVFSINPKVVYPAIGNSNEFLLKNKDDFEEKYFIGKKYIEKYLDYSVNIQNLSDYKLFVSSLIKSERIAKEFGEYINLINLYKRVTPRSINNIINSLPTVELSNKNLTPEELIYLLVTNHYFQ